jgi:C1A family cysteine protease
MLQANRRSFLAAGLALATSVGMSKNTLGADAPGTRAHGGGWIPDRPDAKDQLLVVPQFANPAPRPASRDLSKRLPPAYDQGKLGSCTANAIAGAVQYARSVHGKAGDFIPSRLFIYYQQRKAEQSLSLDAGGHLRDGIESLTTVGVCPEKDWPYDNVAGDPTTHVFPANAQATKSPPDKVVQEAGKYKTISYAPLAQDIAVFESCIAGGYPFMFGFSVYSDADFNDSTKVLRKPNPDQRTALWGHAVLVTGYNQTRRTFRIRNSWGPGAHDGTGYFDMDYDYVLNSTWASNFWVIYQTLAFI